MKTNSILLILSWILIAELSLAQTTFQKTYSALGSNAGYEVKQTKDSNYIVCGYVEGAFNSNDDFRNDYNCNPTSIGMAKILLMKINNTGDTLWTKLFGDSTTKSFGSSVVQDFDSGYVLTGSTESSGAGNADAILLKTDQDGNITWTKTYGGLSFDGGSKLVQTNDSGFIIAGITHSYGTLTRDIYLIKTDKIGDTIWTRTYGGQGYDAASSVLLTYDGGYLVAGSTDSFTADSLDILLIKTNSVGDTLWTKTYGGIRNDECFSALQTADSNYLLTGLTSSIGAGGYDIYVMKINNAGNIIWNKTYGGVNNELGYALKQTDNGGFIMAGASSSPGVMDESGFVIAANDNGDTLWTKGYAPNGVAGFYDVNQTYDGGFIFSGSELQPGAWFNIYLVKTDSLGNSACDNVNISITVGNQMLQENNIPLMISSGSMVTAPAITTGSGIGVNALCVTGFDEVKNNSLIQVLPNPFQSEFYLKGTKANSMIRLFNITGKQILNQKTSDDETKINTENLSFGFYLLNYTEGNKSMNLKLIKNQADVTKW